MTAKLGSNGTNLQTENQSNYNTGRMSEQVTSEQNVSRSFKQMVHNLEDAFKGQVFDADQQHYDSMSPNALPSDEHNHIQSSQEDIFN